MRILFTKNNTVVSKWIRSVLNEPVSHIAFEFTHLETVVHANFFGTKPEFIQEFEQNSTIVFSKDFDIGLVREVEIYRAYMKANCLRTFDFGGIIYRGIRTLLKRWFRIPIGSRNLWADKDMDYCVEAALRLGVDVTGIESKDEMLTPYGYYLLLEKKGAGG